MDHSFTGALPYIYGSTARQVIKSGAWVLAHAPAIEQVRAMTEQTNRQQSNGIVVTVVVLALVAAGLFAASFFVLT